MTARSTLAITSTLLLGTHPSRQSTDRRDQSAFPFPNARNNDQTAGPRAPHTNLSLPVAETIAHAAAPTCPSYNSPVDATVNHVPNGQTHAIGSVNIAASAFRATKTHPSVALTTLA